VLKGHTKRKAESTSGYSFADPPPVNRVVERVLSAEFSHRRPLIRSLGNHEGIVILPATAGGFAGQLNSGEGR